MVGKQFKTFFLASIICLPFSAMADWPVAIVDKVAMHPAQGSIRVSVLENDIGKDLEITEVNKWSENGGRIFKNLDHISYSPNKKHVGEDGFWYAIEDAQGRTNSIRVSINVKPANSNFPAPQEDFAKIPMNTPIRIHVLKNDLFSTKTLTGGLTDGGTITGFNEWSEKGGKIKKIAVYPDGSEQFKYQLHYTPKDNFTGTDTFWYTVQDTESDLTGTAPQPTKVTIEVSKHTKIQEPRPTANPDATGYGCITCLRSGNQNFVLRNDTGKNLIIKLDSSWSYKGGRVTAYPRVGSAGEVSLNYIPKPGFVGEDKVWYVIEDEYGRKEFSVLTIDVNQVWIKSQPANGTVTIDKDGATFVPNSFFTGTDAFTYTVANAEGNEVTAKVTVDVPLTGMSHLPGQGNNPNGLTDLAWKIPLSAGVVGHNTSEPVEDTFTYTLVDGEGNNATATITVTIPTVVNTVNRPPVAINDQSFTDKNTPRTIQVLDNDNDPDGDNITIISVTNGSNGSAVVIDNNIVYTPNNGFLGRDWFAYTIVDPTGSSSTALVSVNVTDINSPPVATNDVATTSQNQTVLIDVLSNDTDIDDDFIVITHMTNPPNGSAILVDNKILYEPNDGFVGQDIIDYTITDGENGHNVTATITITINPL